MPKKPTKSTKPGLSVRVTPELRHEVEDLAYQRGIPLMVLVRDAITRYVADPPPVTDGKRADGRSKAWRRK
jgi:hypothetical protein